MLDQATDLRQLATRRERSTSNVRPGVLMVAGGKGGVGTTTVALNLATAVAQAGARTLVIDADPRGGDIAMLCGIEEQFTLVDLLTDRRTWNDVEAIGPNDVQLLAGCRNWHEQIGSPRAAVELLLERLNEAAMTDIVVLDAGNARGEIVPHLGSHADAVFAVADDSPAAVVGAFAVIRAIVENIRLNRTKEEVQLFRPYLLVNRAASAVHEKMIHGRFARACRRMFGVELQPVRLLVFSDRVRANQEKNKTGLNFQAGLVDMERAAEIAELMLRWKRRAVFNGASVST